MITIHAVQKLHNTSGLNAALYVSSPSPRQTMHSWYARLVATGFPGKMLIMFVHEPSTLTILVPGKSLNKAVPVFVQRLRAMLTRWQFEPSFIERELNWASEYVVSKTDSRSMLGIMNNAAFEVECHCRTAEMFAEIPLDAMEDGAMEIPRQVTGPAARVIFPTSYWAERVSFVPPEKRW